MTDQPLGKIDFDGFKEAREFIKDNSDYCFGYDKFANVYLTDLFPNEVPYELDKVSIAMLDIESECEDGFPDPEKAEEEIYVITIHSNKTGRFHVFTLDRCERTEWPDDVNVYRFPDEKRLLQAFLSFWKKLYPDVVSHWNGDGFDIPYLYNRLIKVLGSEAAKSLSPFGMVNTKKGFDDFGNEVIRYEIMGVSSIDMLTFYKKFVLSPRESYKLDYIGQLDLGKGKTPPIMGVKGHLLYKAEPSIDMSKDYEDGTIESKVKYRNLLREEAKRRELV